MDLQACPWRLALIRDWAVHFSLPAIMTSKRRWLELDTNNGPRFMPADEGSELPSGRILYGYGVRLSAPDSEWTVYTNKRKAKRALRELARDD